MLLVGRSRDRIPVASVTGIFLMDTDRTMCPGVNSASKKWVSGIPLGVKAAGAWGWRPTTLVVPSAKKSGALTYPDPLGPSRRPVVGETFTFTFILLLSWTFLILIGAERDMIINVYFSLCKVPVILVGLSWLFSFRARILKKTWCIKFNENPSSGSRVVPRGKTYRRTER